MSEETLDEKINIEVREYLDLMTPVSTPKLKLCNIDTILHSTIVAMIMEYPKSETTRAMIMSKFGTMPPPEIETGAALREWIETTFTKLLVETPPPRRAFVGVDLAEPPTRDMEVSGVRNNIYTERVVERVYEREDLRVHLTEGAILYAIGDADDMEHLQELLAEVLRDRISEGDYDSQNTRETDREHVRTDEDFRDTEDSSSEISDMDAVMRNIRERFEAELSERELF